MRRNVIAGAALGAASQLSGIGLLLTSAWLIVRAAEQPPVLYLMVAIVSVRFFGVGRAVFRYGERLQTHRVALTRMVDERVRAYRNLDRAAPAGLAGLRRGDIISRVVSDVTIAQDALLRVRLPWVYALISSATVVLVLVSISTPAAIVLLVHVLGCFLIARAGISKIARPDATIDSLARGTMSAEAAALATTSRDLVAHGAVESFTARLHRAIEVQSGTQLRAGRVAGLGAAYVVLSTGIATVVGALSMGEIAPVMAGVVLLAPLAMLEPLLAVMEAERHRPAVSAARDRLEQLDELRSPVVEPFSEIHPAPSGVLVLKDVVAGWSSPLTDPISFSVSPGQVIGLTGPSGVGKSTLALTIVKLLTPRAGTLTLDGVDFADLDGRVVRQIIGLCGQDDLLFDTTIRENLRVAAPDADDRSMRAVLSRVGLGDLLSGLPKGLDTDVGAHGTSLSGGERQRLVMARLLMGNRRILVFDEPTEHLDHAAAAQIMAEIIALRADHSIIVISHSAEVLRACDEFVTIERPESLVSSTAHPALSVG